MILRKAGGQSTPAGIVAEKGPQRRMTATGARRVESCSITALIKCVVPIVTLAMRDGEMLEVENMCEIAVVMPVLGLGVVGVFWVARMPRGEEEEGVGSRMTPSVFVLFVFVRSELLVGRWEFGFGDVKFVNAEVR